MPKDNPGVRRPGEFSFESYFERVAIAIFERLAFMSTLAEQLGVEEDVLATAVPTLIAEVGTLTQSVADEKAAKEQAVKDAEAAEQAAAQDSAERDEQKAAREKAEAELAAIQAVADKLAPVAQAAGEATGQSTAGSGGDEPSGGAPPLQPPPGS